MEFVCGQQGTATMRQVTLATVGFERYSKLTRRAAFLDKMNRVVLWRELCALIVTDASAPPRGAGLFAGHCHPEFG
jgi:hypothetical protein